MVLASAMILTKRSYANGGIIGIANGGYGYDRTDSSDIHITFPDAMG